MYRWQKFDLIFLQVPQKGHRKLSSHATFWSVGHKIWTSDIAKSNPNLAKFYPRILPKKMKQNCAKLYL
jgi:hypothetical protein